MGRIKEQGYAIDNAEHEAGVKCVAAPVRDKSGEVSASISVAGPVFRMAPERIEGELIPTVTETAEEISTRLCYLG